MPDVMPEQCDRPISASNWLAVIPERTRRVVHRVVEEML